GSDRAPLRYRRRWSDQGVRISPVSGSTSSVAWFFSALARLRISLLDFPDIWRQVEVPIRGTLSALHEVIQSAMGWEDRHLWEFKADGRVYGIPDPEWDREMSRAKSTRLATLIDKGVRRFAYVYDMGDDWQHVIEVEAI